MKITISTATRNYAAALVLWACALGSVAQAGPITFRSWKKAGTCPACLCPKAVASMKTGATVSDLSGCLDGLEQPTDTVAVRIITVRSGTARATRTDASGRFSFKDVPNGEYMLLVTRDEKPLALSTIKVPLKMPIWVDVGPRPKPSIDEAEY